MSEMLREEARRPRTPGMAERSSVRFSAGRMWPSAIRGGTAVQWRPERRVGLHRDRPVHPLAECKDTSSKCDIDHSEWPPRLTFMEAMANPRHPRIRPAARCKRESRTASRTLSRLTFLPVARSASGGSRLPAVALRGRSPPWVSPRSGISKREREAHGIPRVEVRGRPGRSTCRTTARAAPLGAVPTSDAVPSECWHGPHFREHVPAGACRVVASPARAPIRSPCFL